MTLTLAILHPSLEIIVSELCILLHLSDCQHADDSMSIAHPVLAIVEGKLCIKTS